VRRSIFLMPFALGLLVSQAGAQTAKSHYEAGERDIKAGLGVDAGREFEQAAKMAPNNTRYQTRFAEFRIEASQWAEAAGRLLSSTSRTRDAQRFLEEALHFDPNNAAAAELLGQVKVANERFTKLYKVQTIYVGEIKGNNGELIREQIKAALANAGRFRVLAADAGNAADSTISGLTEVREIGTRTITNAQAAGSTVGGSVGGGARGNRGGVVGAVVGGFGKTSEKTIENSSTSSLALTSEAIVLSLALKSGEVVWGWDDTKGCNAARVKCAVNDLVSAAQK
jgi:tetratricopeptide (TPR) repeat protein